MCGRYTLTIDKSTIEKRFGGRFYIARQEFEPTFNAAPNFQLARYSVYMSERTKDAVVSVLYGVAAFFVLIITLPATSEYFIPFLIIVITILTFALRWKKIIGNARLKRMAISARYAAIVFLALVLLLFAMLLVGCSFDRCEL